MTKVVHCHQASYDVYIGRPSKWGNPFHIGQDYQGIKLDRKAAIAAFRDWFMYSDTGSELREQISELCGKTLGCWCKPKACHGDILAEIADTEDKE